MTAQPLTVAVVGDTQPEGTETFTVTLVSPVGASLGDGSALGTILDTDVVSVIAIGSASTTEGDSGSVTATFTVTLSPPSSQTVTVGLRDSGRHGDGGQ